MADLMCEESGAWWSIWNVCDGVATGGVAGTVRDGAVAGGSGLDAVDL